VKQKRALTSIQNRNKSHNNHDDDDDICNRNSSMNSIDGQKKEKKLGPLQKILDMKRNLSNRSSSSKHIKHTTSTDSTANDKKHSSITKISSSKVASMKNDNIVSSNPNILTTTATTFTVAFNTSNSTTSSKQNKFKISKKIGGVYIDPTIEAEDKEIQRLGRLLGINKGNDDDNNNDVNGDNYDEGD